MRALEQEKLVAASSNFYDKELGITYAELFDIYAQSEFGQHQKDQKLRYERFHYERDMMLVDFGDKVHPLFHQADYSMTMGRILVRQVEAGQADELSPLDIVALRIVAPTHDSGECTHPSLLETCGGVVDDVEYHEKLQEHEDQEAIIRRHIFETYFGFIPDVLRERIEEIITMKWPDDPATRLHRVGEDLDYYETGMRAVELATPLEEIYKTGEHHKTTVDSYRALQVGRFAVVVPNCWRQVLEDRAEDFPYVADRLADSRPMLRHFNQKVLRLIVS